jgi:hypothetical protein
MMRSVVSGIAAAFAAVLATAAATAAGWSAGVATADITPTGPVWMAGYAARKTPSEGVTLPLRAKALALSDGANHTVVVVTADLIGFDRPLMTAVTDRVKARHGLPREAVALFASHTHTGPALKNVARTSPRTASTRLDRSPTTRTARTWRTSSSLWSTLHSRRSFRPRSRTASAVPASR